MNPSQHIVVTTIMDGAKLGQIETLDYNFELLSNLSFEEVYVSGEPPEHRERVRSSILENGIIEPIIVLQRRGRSRPVLIEGHHRAIVAYEHSLPAPVAIHRCACPSSDLDYFGLCEFIRKECAIQKERSAHRGWEWRTT